MMSLFDENKITNIPNVMENSKRKDSDQMANSKAQTHQTNGKQLSYSRLSHLFSRSLDKE